MFSSELIESASVLRSVTMPNKNFSSRVKNQLLSFLSSHSPCHTTVHIVKLQPPVSSSGCMTINCPLHCTAQSCILSHDGPCDSPTEQMDSAMYHSSLQNPCPDLDPSSSTDSTQTHDSLITPESPHLPSPVESLEEGTTEGVTQVQAHDPVTQDTMHVTEVTQVRTNDSLVTVLSWLSLEPDPDPLLDHQ